MRIDDDDGDGDGGEEEEEEEAETDQYYTSIVACVRAYPWTF